MLSLRGVHGLTRVGPALLVAAGCIGAFVLVTPALRSPDVGPVHAVWPGLGAVCAVAGGAVIYGERVTPAVLTGAALIVTGVAVLYLGGAAHG